MPLGHNSFTDSYVSWLYFYESCLMYASLVLFLFSIDRASEATGYAEHPEGINWAGPHSKPFSEMVARIAWVLLPVARVIPTRGFARLRCWPANSYSPFRIPTDSLFWHVCASLFSLAKTCTIVMRQRHHLNWCISL